MTLVASPEATCKACGKGFLRFRTTQAVCGPRCAAKSVKVAKRKEAENTRARRVALMSRRDWIEAAQKAFNEYIRLRDADKPCICCGSWGDASDEGPGGKWDAGHFLSRGAYPELRFTPDNCHRQLKSCNAGSSKYAMKGRTVAQGYRLGLIARIGLERVEALEGPHPPAKWSVDELKTISDGYKILAKQLREKHAA